MEETSKGTNDLEVPVRVSVEWVPSACSGVNRLMFAGAHVYLDGEESASWVVHHALGREEFPVAATCGDWKVFEVSGSWVPEEPGSSGRWKILLRLGRGEKQKGLGLDLEFELGEKSVGTNAPFRSSSPHCLQIVWPKYCARRVVWPRPRQLWSAPRNRFHDPYLRGNRRLHRTYSSLTPPVRLRMREETSLHYRPLR